MNEGITNGNEKIHLGMTVGEYIKILNEGVIKAPELAGLLGTSKSNVGRKLGKIQYSYDNSAKIYKYVGEGDPPESMTMGEVLGNKGNTKVILKSNTESERRVKGINTRVNDQLTVEELNIIREMIKERQGKIETLELGDEISGVTLFERVKGIELDDKKRATIVISETVLKSFKKFAKKEMLNQSDLFQLALEDFMKKYN